MEWIDNLNKSIEYIEEHITDEVDYEQLAKIACCSAYHFQRMFAYLANAPLSEYIRRRRMSLAALDLQNGTESVTAIGLKYGYSSPTAFNRSFKNIHGIAPSVAKARGAKLKSYPPISFSVAVKGGKELCFRIEDKPSFRVVGISAPLQNEIEKNFKVVPQMWAKAAMFGTVAKLSKMMNKEPMGLLGVSACGDAEQWKYYIAVSTDAPAGKYEEYIVPAASWAIFSGEGPSKSIQELEQRIVTEWLPSSGYEYVNAPDIEVYLNADPKNAKYEVWIPIQKSKGV